MIDPHAAPGIKPSFIEHAEAAQPSGRRLLLKTHMTLQGLLRQIQHVV